DAGKISDPQRKMLGQAFFSAQRMVYLIADLLNVSRLKTGKFVIESKPVNLSKVIKTEVAQLHEGLAAKNLKLEINAPKGFPDAEVDEMKIRQVIMNFLDNAIYYTPQDGKITIDLEEKDNNVNLTVSDTGIGVPKEEQGKLFTKFYRAENAKKARPDGTGLGLFMAKKVIEAHKGSVIFESKVGTGSSFGFSIPLEKGKG
ncbi:MAG: signal transduction histidine kinase, partial [Candidatus Saccharimonadales bacterium]